MTSEVLNKPEKYVMVSVSEDTLMMSGSTTPAALVTVKSIGGITPEKNRIFSQRICSFLESEMGISPQRVYINFFDVDAENWGWDRGTFG